MDSLLKITIKSGLIEKLSGLFQKIKIYLSNYITQSIIHSINLYYLIYYFVDFVDLFWLISGFI